MTVRFKLLMRLFLSSILFWMAAMLLFYLIRFNGLEQQLSIFSSELLELPLKTYFRYSIFIGFILGVTHAIIELIFNLFLSKKLVPVLVIILKSIIYFIIIVIILSLASIYLENQFDIDLKNEQGWWQKNGMFWSMIVYFMTMSIVISLLRIALDKFGKGMFFNMLIGKYRRPQEEERILMFLDLKDSTAIAEQLGHKQYSNFIQDCFKDLNTVLDKYEADVYQYVGDEAVLSWATNKGFRKNNCVNLFFSFQKRLNKKQHYYKKQYNFNPTFKAGLHCGKLMIAEVGTIKKEIAYHGDVINTAARIQSLCNTYDAQLLVSETLLSRSTITLNYDAVYVDKVILKGKENTVSILKVTEKVSK